MEIEEEKLEQEKEVVKSVREKLEAMGMSSHPPRGGSSLQVDPDDEPEGLEIDTDGLEVDPDFKMEE